MRPLHELNAVSLPAAAAEYQQMGFTITPLRPKSKAAYEQGWNAPGYRCRPDHWQYFPGDNLGMVLEPSGMCVLDIDAVDEFRIAVQSIGLTPNDGKLPFWESNTAGIRSGKPNRGKLIFKVPEGVQLEYHKLLWSSVDGKKHTVFELRCGYVQDVLPPSIHPDTGRSYQWVGREIQPMPDDLLLLWQQWETFEPALKKADRFYREEPQTPHRGRPRKHSGRDLIREWCSTQDLRAALERHGYKPVGNRYLSPHSHSMGAGVIVSGDGQTFYSFGESDPFADGHQHNAFDLMLHYEHRDNFPEALQQVRGDLGLTAIADKDLCRTIKEILEGRRGGQNER